MNPISYLNAIKTVADSYVFNTKHANIATADWSFHKQQERQKEGKMTFPPSL